MDRRFLEALGPGLAAGLLIAMTFGATGRLESGIAAGAPCALLVTVCLFRWPPRSRLVWWSLAIPVLALPDLVLGAPSGARVLATVALSLAALALVRWLEGPPRISVRAADLSVAAGLTVYALLTWGAMSYLSYHFGDRMNMQDTAYFEQQMWGYVTGRNFFMGSSQAWWKYDPPLSTHFAMHSSPVLFLVAFFYRLWQSYYLLHLLQILAITSAAVPVYRLVRDIDPFAAILFTLAYLVNAAVLSQTQVAFHELAFAAPLAAWSAYFFLRQRLLPFLGCLVAAMCVREDLALFAGMASVAAALSPGRRRRAAWIGLPAVLGALGWILAGRVMAYFGHNGDQVVNALFSRFGTTPGEIVIGMLTHPLQVLEMMFEEHRSRYVLGLFRPGLLAALASPLTLLVAPVLLINLLVRGAGTAWLDVHYSVYLPAVIMPAALTVWLGWTPRLAARAGVAPEAVRATLAALMIISSLLSFLDVFPIQKLKAYLPPPDEPEIHAVLASIPPEASVAAPRSMLHALARRERLYIVNRWLQYSVYDPEYIVVERDFSQVHLSDGTFAPYAAYARYLAGDPRFQVLVSLPHYVLYRDKASSARVEPAIASEAR